MKDIDVLKNLDKLPLSKATKSTYRSSLKRVIKTVKGINYDEVEFGDDEQIFRIITNYKKSADILKDRLENDSTLQATIAVIAKVMTTYGLDSKKKTKKIYEKWTSDLLEVTKRLEERNKQQTPTERQSEKMICWDEVKEQLAIEAKKDPYSETHVLLALLRAYPRRVRDLSRLRIVQDKEEDELFDDSNRIRLYGRNPTLVIKDFKMAKKMGEFEDQIPKDLIKVIRGSLKRNDRNYLFIRSSDQLPYDDNLKGSHAFQQRVSYLLTKAFNRKITTNSLRHAVASDVVKKYGTELSFAEGEKIANKLGHSFQRLQLYAHRENVENC